MTPVLVAVIGVTVLGAKQVSDSDVVAGQAARTSALATATATVGSLVHEVASEFLQASEVLQTNKARLPNDKPALLVHQHATTDAAVAAFTDGVRTIRSVAPDIAPLCVAAEQALVSLTYARELGVRTPADLGELRGYYDHIMTSLLAVSAALPPQLRDTRLIELARAASLAAELDRLTVLQLDLIMRALRERELRPAEFTLLAGWVGGETKDAGSLRDLNVAGANYDGLARQSSYTTAAEMRQTILDGQGDPSTLTATPAVWFAAQSQRRQDLWDLEVELSRRLDTASARLYESAREQTVLLSLLYIMVVLIILAGAMATAVRISRRLRQTRHAALTASQIELPAAIADVTTARDADGVRDALNGSSARVDSMLVAGPDEIGELASAFGAIHRQALRLAADQALLRMEVQAIFVALSRRGQTLIQRQLHLIDEFGRHETDPGALSRLFALDHLAARMRRNEENLLVLAGGEPGRWITRPVAVLDVIRAAAQEIEEFRRVEAREIPELAVTAHVAGDMIHLLAELLENATTFSPPRSVVRVGARLDADGLVITVTDTGIGIPHRNLAEANDRLARPSALTSTLVGTMGLLVVARLAQRHGINVRLDSVPAGGTTATVVVPTRMVLPVMTQERLQPERWLRGLRPPDALPTATAMSAPSTIPAINPAPARPHRWSQDPNPRPATAVSGPAPATGPTSPGRHRSDPTPWTIAGRTAAGYPPVGRTRAAPPHRLVEPAASQAEAARSLHSGTPDPETVRARLSSLASGLAAASAHLSSLSIQPNPDLPASTSPAHSAPPLYPITPPEDHR